MENLFEEIVKAIVTGWRIGRFVGRGVGWVTQHMSRKQVYRDLGAEQANADQHDAHGRRQSHRTKIYAEDP